MYITYSLDTVLVVISGETSVLPLLSHTSLGSVTRIQGGAVVRPGSKKGVLVCEGGDPTVPSRHGWCGDELVVRWFVEGPVPTQDERTDG